MAKGKLVASFAAPTFSKDLGMRGRFLSTWPIARKTGLISVLSLAGLLLVASGYFAVRWYEGGIQQVRDRSEEAVLVTRMLSENFLLARRAEKDFLLRLDEKYYERHVKTGADVAELLTKLAEISPDQSADAELFLTGYVAYNEQFRKVVEAWKKSVIPRMKDFGVRSGNLFIMLKHG